MHREWFACARQGRLRSGEPQQPDRATHRAKSANISSSKQHSRSSSNLPFFVQLCNWQYISLDAAKMLQEDASWGELKGFETEVEIADWLRMSRLSRIVAT